jgi:SM-20-related protein
MNSEFSLNEMLFDTIITGLVDEGLVVIDDFLPQSLTLDLYQHINKLVADSTLKQASIGRQQSTQLNQAIRTDKTHWINGVHRCEQHYLALMDQCKQQLNQHLYLGLNHYESHFAHYARGDFYKRHLDAFKGKSNRSVTTVLYLNPEWQSTDGGELVIYDPVDEDDDTVLKSLSPRFGTLVMFMSELFPHEVLPAQRDRYSISGWFRTDSPLAY